jgi:hypothetical protein
MKQITKLIYLFILLISSGQVFSQVRTLPVFFAATNEFLESNVKNGSVNYKEIKNKQKDLNDLVNYLGQQQQFANVASEKAFYINAYNILVIKGIIDAYPVKGPMAVPNFFDKKIYKVNAAAVSLNNIENDILRKKFPDARLHFALVCGALSCPPLPSFAIKPEKIETQLTELTTRSIRNNKFTRLDAKNRKAAVSMIFNWYKDDFIADSGSVLNFLNKYLASPIAAQTNVTYYDYDWTLNGR